MNLFNRYKNSKITDNSNKIKDFMKKLNIEDTISKAYMDELLDLRSNLKTADSTDVDYMEVMDDMNHIKEEIEETETMLKDRKSAIVSMLSCIMPIQGISNVIKKVIVDIDSVEIMITGGFDTYKDLRQKIKNIYKNVEISNDSTTRAKTDYCTIELFNDGDSAGINMLLTPAKQLRL